MRRTVLIVDDETQICESLGRFICRKISNGPLPFETSILSAASGDEAQKILESPAGSAIDLVITDYDMPGMSGIELVRWMRTFRPRLPALLMSGRFNDQRHAEAAELKLSTLDKPFGGDTIVKDILPLLRPQILVAEDEIELREAEIQILREAFDGAATIVEATNGRHATDILGDKRVDLVLTDCDMPSMSGLELVGHLRCKDLEAPAAILTGREADDFGDAPMQLGFRLFQKPANFAKAVIPWIVREIGRV